MLSSRNISPRHEVRSSARRTSPLTMVNAMLVKDFYKKHLSVSINKNLCCVRGDKKTKIKIMSLTGDTRKT